MRIASGVAGSVTPEWCRFVRQMGATGVVVHMPDLPLDTGIWEYEDLLTLRHRIESFELELVALENTPFEWYTNAMLGRPGKDEEIRRYQQTLRNIGRAGITRLGFCWAPNIVQTWSTQEVLGRGGASHRHFDLADAQGRDVLTHGEEFDAATLWSTFDYFMEAVLPVAEDVGVQMCLHPDDPPVEQLGGIDRIFRSFDAFKRATEEFDSPSLALNYCMGTWSEMGPGVLEALTYFILRDKVGYIHFRDVQGHVPRFNECFLGEGNVDVVEVVSALKRMGFSGYVEEDHVPVMEGDTAWGHRARALTSGYIQGVSAAVDRFC